MLKSKAWDRRQTHLLREKTAREMKSKREAKADEVVGTAQVSFTQIVDDLAQRRLFSSKTLQEIEADEQDKQAEMLGTAAVLLLSFGWEDDAVAFAKNAFGKAENAWRLRNPEPMMQEVHRFWLDKQAKRG